MSKASFWQRGETIDYTNETTETIEANTIITFGSRIGVAGTDILPGETGSLHVTGVFEFPKSETEIVIGGDVYYSESNGITASSADGIKAGFAVAGAAAGSSTVLVKINA